MCALQLLAFWVSVQHLQCTAIHCECIVLRHVLFFLVLIVTIRIWRHVGIVRDNNCVWGTQKSGFYASLHGRKQNAKREAEIGSCPKSLITTNKRVRKDEKIEKHASPLGRRVMRSSVAADTVTPNYPFQSCRAIFMRHSFQSAV